MAQSYLRLADLAEQNSKTDAAVGDAASQLSLSKR
jgi:hypothetical protein